jgi:hypothetical protein
MKNFSQLSNETHLHEYVKKLQQSIHKIPQRMSEKIRRKEITLIDWDDVRSLDVVDIYLRERNEFPSNTAAVDSGLKSNLWHFIENQLIIDFSTYISNSYSSRETLYRLITNFNLESFLDQWYREYHEKKKRKEPAKELAETLTLLFRPELESFFKRELHNFCQTSLTPQVKKLALHRDTSKDKTRKDFTQIFDEQVQELFIPLILDKFRENIQDMLKEDCEKIALISSELKKAENRTLLLEQKISELEKTTAEERKKTEKLEKDNEIEVRLFGLFVFKSKTKNNVIFQHVLITLIFIFLIYAFILLLDKSNIAKTPGYLDLQSIMQRLDQLEKTCEQILVNQKITKTTAKGFKYDSYRSVVTNADGKKILSVDIDILSDRYRWECGKSEYIVYEDKIFDPAHIISDYREHENLTDAEGLICLGMASVEGNKKDEENRAKNRVATLLDAARKARVYEDCPFYGLNLGQYVGKTDGNKQKSCSESTLWQRRVVLIKIITQLPGLTDEELKEGAISALIDKAKNKHIEFPIDIREYSLFETLNLQFGSNRNRETDQYQNE